MKKPVADWHKIYLNNKYALPGSQGKAILLLQSFYIPLQACLSLVSGRYAADYAALKEYANSSQIICEVCGCQLTRTGDGHNKEICSIYKRAVEVLTDETDPQERILRVEQERLKTKLDEMSSKLASVNAGKV